MSLGGLPRLKPGELRLRLEFENKIDRLHKALRVAGSTMLDAASVGQRLHPMCRCEPPKPKLPALGDGPVWRGPTPTRRKETK